MSDEIIKCLKCGHVIISGHGMSCLFSQGTSIECRNCGNKHVFGNEITLTKLLLDNKHDR